MAVEGIDLAGPLPREVQSVSVISAGVFADARQPQAAHALLDFLSTPAAARVYKAKGLDPA
jgi:molybdate transport system substrate-binding protein